MSMNIKNAFLLAVAAIVCLTSATSQVETSLNGSIEIGEKYLLKSSILNETREVYISLPTGHDTSHSEFPVVYVLDAEYRFAIAQAIHSYFNITTRMPQSILVGITNYSNETRTRDFFSKKHGGQAENFIQFIKKELIPFVNRKFNGNGTQFLAGHSHAAVFTIFTMLHEPDLFDGFVATDPSLKSIVNEGPDQFQINLEDKSLYLASSDVAYGYLEGVAADIQADFAIFKNYIFQNQNHHNLNFTIDHIQDDHGNSYIQGFSRGLRYMFGWRVE